MITSTAKAEHATVIINILMDESIKHENINDYLNEITSKFEDCTSPWEYYKIHISPAIWPGYISKGCTRFRVSILCSKIPSEATIDKYRLMAKNAVEAKYNELKNPFDKWSVKA